jgi:cyclic pyranopterin phosphate synthase
MPKEVFGSRFHFLPRAEILTFEAIHRLARIFHSLGVRRIRLTGGEPLLRADLPVLVRLLASLPETEVLMTTNGSLLAEKAPALAAAGLARVTVSLDALDEAVFQRMNDVQVSVTRVLAGIEAAVEAGLTPVKINAVAKRGVNGRAIVEIARRFKGTGLIARFIEYMDVGNTNGWRMDDVISGAEIIRRIAAELPVEPVSPNYRGEVAKRWRYLDGDGEIGVITSVTQPFCGDCSRARLSADGKLYTCLFAADGIDLRQPLRQQSDDRVLRELIQSVWSGRRDRYSELRTRATAVDRRVEMSYIGG